MVIFQKPNGPLLIAITGWIIAFLSTGLIHKIGQTFSITAIIIWAYLELTKGINIFRKILGGIVLVWAMYSLLNNLK